MNIFRSLVNSSFALLWSGQTISRLGDSFYTVALALWVLEKTHSATAMGLALVCFSLPMLLLLLQPRPTVPLINGRSYESSRISEEPVKR